MTEAETKKFVSAYVAKKSVVLSGIDWNMVIATLQESADNCFRCKRKGCGVCQMTRKIAERIKQQLREDSGDAHK